MPHFVNTGMLDPGAPGALDGRVLREALLQGAVASWQWSETEDRFSLSLAGVSGTASAVRGRLADFLALAAPADRPALRRALHRAVASGSTCACELSVGDDGHGQRWVAVQGRSIPERPGILQGTAYDVTARVAGDRRALRQQAALLQLAIDPALAQGDLDGAIHSLTEAGAATLEVERASVWFYTPGHDRIRCADLYERSAARHSSGMELAAAQYPVYFAALGQDRAIAADDARRDVRTREFAGEYLDRFGIASMMDATIRRGDEILGVVCHEHTGGCRHWNADEQSFASSLADLVALAWERSRCNLAETSLRNNDRLLRAIVDNTSSVIYVKDRDGRYLLVNRRYEELAGKPAGEIVGHTDAELFPGVSVAHLRANDEQALQAGTLLECEEEVVLPGAAGPSVFASVKFPLRDDTGEVYAIGGVSTDITHQRQALAALAESELRFRSLAEASHEGIFIHTAGRIVDCNDRFLEMVGYDRSEISQCSVFDLVMPGDVDLARARLESGTEEPYQITGRRRDGSSFPAEIRARQGEFHGQPVRLVVVRDVSDQVRAERALRESEERYRAFLAQSSEGIFRLDLPEPLTVSAPAPAHEQVAVLRRARIAECNPAFARLCGCSMLDLVDHSLDEIDADCGELLAQFAASGCTRGRGEWATLAAGERQWREGSLTGIIDDGRLLRAWGMVRDVTAAKESEARLRDSEERFAKAFRASPEAMIVTRIDDGRVLDVNEGFERHTGYRASEVVGKSTFEFDMWAQAEARREFVALLARDGRVRDFEAGVRIRSGEVRICELSGERIDIGGVPCVVSIARDVTEQRRQEEILLNIAQGVSAETGEAFFQSLVAHLAPALQADVAFVGELVPGEEQKVRARAVFADGAAADNFDYVLNDTPCASVVEAQGVCCFPSDVQAAFPRDAMLVEMGIQGYVGAPLLDSDGHALGLVVVLYRRPVAEPMLCERLLQIFAVRASAELERQRDQQTLAESEERYRAYIANSAEGILRFDLSWPLPVNLPAHEQVRRIAEQSRVVECNQRAASLHGRLVVEQLLGRSMADLLGEESARSVLDAFVAGGHRLDGYEIKLPGTGEVAGWVEVAAAGMVDAGALVRVWMTLRDAAERHQHVVELEYQANHDALTGLPNRNWLRAEIARAVRESPGRDGLSLLLLDLNGFKEINDTLGHHTGDQLLLDIGQRIARGLKSRQADLARLGGDEFAILARGAGTPEAAATLAGQVLATLARPFDVAGLRLQVSGSIGIALSPRHGESATTLLRCADVAMYAAKRESTGFLLYRGELDVHTPERLALTTELGAAIESDQLALVYQPKVSLADRRVVGFEALVRWPHPAHGLLLPPRFVPLAETGALMKPLSLWVAEQAARQLRRWRDQGLSARVAINLSARNLVDIDFPDALAERILTQDVDPGDVEIELTESALIADPDRAAQVLGRIHAMGIRLAIDDFGTGFSSLSYLRRLPVYALKIDASFVRHMLTSSQDRIIVHSTINLAHNLGLRVVAEGVEDATTLQALRDAGCDQVQGYHVGRPMSPSEVLRWLSGNSWAS